MDDLTHAYRQWQTAEDAGREEEAEAAFTRLFESAAPAPVVPLEFTAATLRAVAEAAVHDARRARRTRRALVWLGAIGGLLAAYFSAGLLVAVGSAVGTWILEVLIDLIVGASTSPQGGSSVWNVLSGLGRAAAALTASPAVTIAILAIQAIAVAALVALQRFLGSDWESFK